MKNNNSLFWLCALLVIWLTSIFASAIVYLNDVNSFINAVKISSIVIGILAGFIAIGHLVRFSEGYTDHTGVSLDDESKEEDKYE